jgi:sulfur carrier protein
MQITINGKTKQFELNVMTIADLVECLEITGKRIAIECNAEIVPRSQYAEAMLKDGDKLEIVGAVGGG